MTDELKELTTLLNGSRVVSQETYGQVSTAGACCHSKLDPDGWHSPDLVTVCLLQSAAGRRQCLFGRRARRGHVQPALPTRFSTSTSPLGRKHRGLYGICQRKRLGGHFWKPQRPVENSRCDHRPCRSPGPAGCGTSERRRARSGPQHARVQRPHFGSNPVSLRSEDLVRQVPSQPLTYGIAGGHAHSVRAHY